MVMILLAMILCMTPASLYAENDRIPPPFPPFLEHLDQNGDNRITIDEFPEKKQIFDHFDVNGDGFIDANDVPERPRHIRDTMDRMDKNNDGQISLDEFPGPAEHFRMLDKDEDELLTQEELDAAPPGPPPGKGFEADDVDKDGKVSKEEFSGPAGHFTHLDRNGDGYLTMEEVQPPRF